MRNKGTIRSLLFITLGIMSCSMMLSAQSSYLISNTIMNKDSIQNEGKIVLEDIPSTRIINRRYIQLMVVPNFKSYKEIKDTLLKSTINRIALNTISSAFESKGFVVKDFIESLKVSEEKYNTQNRFVSDPFQLLVENAPADIFIYFDVILNEDSNGKQVSVQLTAKDKYTANRYATSPVFVSTKRYWDDIYKPLFEALSQENKLDLFVSELDEWLIKLEKEGRKVDLQIEFQNILTDEVLISGKSIVPLILDWVKENSLGLNGTPGLGKSILKLDTSIPILDEESDRSYTPLDFGLDLKSYLQKILLQSNAKFKNIELNVVKSRVKIILI